jgi:hypothetical protein
MKSDPRLKILFVIALASRGAAMPMLGHWGLILVTVLLGVPLDWAADYTLVVTVALAVTTFLALAAVNRDGRISERMSRGPAELLRHSMLVMGGAMASSVGGLLLLLQGAGPAALWAMGLGTFVAVCETSALVGSMFLGTPESQPREEDR